MKHYFWIPRHTQSMIEYKIPGNSSENLHCWNVVYMSYWYFAGQFMELTRSVLHARVYPLLIIVLPCWKMNIYIYILFYWHSFIWVCILVFGNKSCAPMQRGQTIPIKPDAVGTFYRHKCLCLYVVLKQSYIATFKYWNTCIGKIIIILVSSMQVTRNWVTSDKPIGSPVQVSGCDCECVSAGWYDSSRGDPPQSLPAGIWFYTGEIWR